MGDCDLPEVVSVHDLGGRWVDVDELVEPSCSLLELLSGVSPLCERRRLIGGGHGRPQRRTQTWRDRQQCCRRSRGILGRMAYDDELANRIREVVHGEPGLSEKRMFGGLAFLVDGKLAVSASSMGGLLLRIDPRVTERLVSEPHVGRFEMRGRQMDGWLRVDAEVLETDDELRRWVSHGVTYARSLPPK
jgi:TfoX/Sxy family transcriptional regulator of competence genes